MQVPSKLTKQQVCDAIAEAVGVPKDPLGPGSKEHLQFLRAIARALGLGEDGGKHEITQRILLSLGQPWDEGCMSTGDTVTGAALGRILDGLFNAPERTDAVHQALVAQLLASGAHLDRPEGYMTPKRLRTGHDVFVRSPEVAAYILRCAAGSCEGCNSQAPFVRADGTPYLEVHHVEPLADGGPDTVDNTVALCPNCHRRAHHAMDIAKFSTFLREHVLKARRAGSAPPCPPDRGR